MENSTILIAIYVVKLISISIALYYLFKSKKYSSYYVIPLYSIVLSSSTLTPIYLDTIYSYLINYFILLTIFATYYMYFREKSFLIMGFTYLFLYFFTCTIPYVMTNCTTYSLSCLYISVLSPVLVKYIVVATGLIILILLNTVVSLYSRSEYIIFHVVSIIYGLSQYIVLIKNIHGLIYSIVTVALTPLIYYTSKYIGFYLFPEDESVEIVFDKYVSINALSVFLTLALSTLYSILWR